MARSGFSTIPLSMLVLGGILIRKKAVPVWCGILLCTGAISFPMGRILRIEAVAHATDLLLFVSAAWIGWRYLRSHNLGYRQCHSIIALKLLYRELLPPQSRVVCGGTCISPPGHTA